jgi:hypothetical protein
LVIEKLANIPLSSKATALENSSTKSASLLYLKALKLQLEEVQEKIPLNPEGNGKSQSTDRFVKCISRLMDVIQN